MMSARFLVVDDSDLNLKVTSTVLQKLGIIADCVSDVRKAYSLLEENNYDLILMDYMMPGINGIEATKHIRSMSSGSHNEDYYRNIPIIALTAEDNPQERLQMLTAGINDIIPKPVKLPIVRGLLNRWCAPSSPEISIYGIDDGTLQEMLATDRAGYIEILSIFCEDIPDKHIRIENALQQGDYETYTVEIHRIKGEANMISAVSLSATAKALEFVGKAITGVIPNGHTAEENKHFIRVTNPSLMHELDRTYTDILSFITKEKAEAARAGSAAAPAADSSKTETPAASPEVLSKIKRYVSHALEAVDAGDTALTKEWLGEIMEVIDNCSN